MIVGLGSGSTAEATVRAIGERVAQGLAVTAVATSGNTARLAVECGISLVHLNEVDELDVGFDGADEIDPDLNLVKGRGGALLWEKLVARSCARFVVVSASEKLVDRLGVRMPLPVEIVPFGWRHTIARIAALGCDATLRTRPDSAAPYQTDEGNYIADCATGPIFDPISLDLSLKAITGVVDHGLFIGIADEAMIVGPDGDISVRTPAAA
ncbi:MAG: ribose-5-phosphate isomerase RpiA [Thermomicrobiales bacterium]|nr:ribose-5-phosphate isomerase RpiA [Thermomicrobiales bacterium]